MPSRYSAALREMKAASKHSRSRKVVYVREAETSRTPPSAAEREPQSLRMRSWSLFSECARVSTLHGLRYIGAPESTPLERVFWSAAFLASLCSGVVVISLVWDKWERNPVIVAFRDRVSPVWDIPFPAVTICNDNKVKASFLSLVDGEHQGRSPQDLEECLAHASIICPYMEGGRPEQALHAGAVASFIAHAAPSCAETMVNYTWMGESHDACADFVPTITEEGLCFTFNMLPLGELMRPGVSLGLQSSVAVAKERQDARDWTPDGGYREDADAFARPRRSGGGGMYNGLQLTLRQNPGEINRRCSGPYAGFKVSLHSPVEVPRPDKFFARAGANMEFVFAVKPNVFGTDDSLVKIAPRKRMCYFGAEKWLAYFRVYSQQNCRLECIANLTLRRCACVAFYMPALRATPVCGAGALDCVAASRRERKLAKQQNMSFEANDGDCDCLPSCVQLDYDGETSASPQDWAGFYREVGQPDNSSTMWTNIAVFFKNDQFVSVHRNELFGFVEFISDCGGILSLFLGFSILSLAEIFYFVTLRPSCGKRATVAPSDVAVGVGRKGELGWEADMHRKHGGIAPH